MKKDEIVIELHRSANENGLLPTLYAIFGKRVKVFVPFSKKACYTEIDAIDFSVRALNALKRAGLFTIGDVIDSIAGEDPTLTSLTPVTRFLYAIMDISKRFGVDHEA